MATYMPGMTDQVPDIPLYTPDYSFMERMMRRKDSMYEEGARQVQNAFGSIINSPLSNQENMLVRDKYVKDAQEQLKQASELDFSRPENVQMAQNIFAPFWEDKDLLADATKTRVMEDAIRTGYAYSTASDEKERNKFWMTGVDYVENGIKKLKSAKRGDGSIQQVQARKYIPNYDLMGYLHDQAGKEGIKIVRSVTDPSGYRITYTNGDDTKELFESWVEKHLQGNSGAMDVFRVQGTVNYENRVNEYRDLGLDEQTSKANVAKEYIGQQKKHYENLLEKNSKNMVDVGSQMKAIDDYIKTTYAGMEPTDEVGIKKMQEYKRLQSIANETDKNTAEYSRLVKEYSDTNSDKYKSDYNTMVSGGEGYFATKYRNDFIRGAAQALAIENSSVAYDLDPVKKFQLEMKKEYDDMALRQSMNNADNQTKWMMDQNNTNGNGSGDGSGGSGSGTSTARKEAQAILDTPIPLGYTTKGRDPVSAYDRMNAAMTQSMNDFVTSGDDLLGELLMDNNDIKISKSFRDNLKNVIQTGKFLPGTDYKAIANEAHALEQANVLPKGVATSADTWWKKPHELYSNLVKYAESYYDASGDNVRKEVMGARIAQMRSAQKYYGLKQIYTEADKKAKEDPVVAQLYSNGKIKDEGSFLKGTLGAGTLEEYVEQGLASVPFRQYGSANQLDANDGARIRIAEQRKQQWAQGQETYKKLLTQNTKKLSEIVAPYLDNEGAYIGRTVRLSTDNEGQVDRAQVLAQQAMNDDNLRKQIINKDGVFPINIAMLEEAGAEPDEIKTVMSTFGRGTVSEYISSVDLTKIGSRGKPSVFINYRMDKVKEKLGKEVSQETIDAIGRSGLEIEIADGVIPELNSAFGKGVLDEKLFDKNGEASAPDFVKKMGYDYRVLRSGDTYKVRIDYPTTLANGQVSSDKEIITLPATTSISELEGDLLNRISLIQQRNYQAKRNSSTFAAQSQTSTPVTLRSWDDVKKEK